MTRLLTLKDFSRESSLVSTRAVTAAIIAGALTLVLMGRLVQLQVLEHRHFTTLSEDNRVKSVPVAPTRGLIFDRNGEVLAQNLPAYGLEVVPELVEDVDTLLTELREIIEISDADEQEFLTVLARKRRFEKVPLRLQLDDREVARFAVNRHRFPGVDIDARLVRDYPHGELGVHLIGYVGRIDQRELDSIDQADYRGTSHIGKTGIEKSREDSLHGKVGRQYVETNAQGRILRVLERLDPVPGSNLFLTMDVRLQRTAEMALGEERGAIVAVEPMTGAVLAMASTPGFDPNLFVHGIDVGTYRRLRRSPERPLFNRAINGQYPPGSTIKPFLGLAGLERNVGRAQGTAWCPGWFRLPGNKRRYRDWKKSGHGRIGLQDAIVQSCDVYFYQLALALDIDRMHESLSSFGFGTRTGISLRSESSGLMPSRTWKRSARGQPWYPGDTINIGIGQGDMLATPLQLASATAAIATRGVRMRPRIVDREVDPGSGEIRAVEPETTATIESLDAANWERIIEAMAGVVHGPKGTARRIGAGLAYRMAGKTGTAQVFSMGQNEEYDADKLDKRLHDHGLFVAFAPIEEPRIAVAVIVENGGSGSGAAAPLARIVIDAWLGDAPTTPPAPGQRTLRAAVSEGDSEPSGTARPLAPVPG